MNRRKKCPVCAWIDRALMVVVIVAISLMAGSAYALFTGLQFPL